MVKPIPVQLPPGYSFRDTGQPRGERRLWVLLNRTGAAIKESINRRSLSRYAWRLHNGKITRPPSGPQE